jgi:molecular chaperone HtpG
MADMNTTEKHQFQTEIEQLLNIVIHSLYTDKEIFVRELISNAADALEKLRFLTSSGKTIFQAETPPGIAITADEKEGTIIFTDTGVGMTRKELVENLGTVAHSGSKAFLQKLKENHDSAHPAANLIGQFGVGFYAAFMAAKKVTVDTRSYLPEETPCRWISEGSSGYELESIADAPRGTKILLHLKNDQKEFANADRLEGIIKRYSNFVPFPITLNGKSVNTVGALWARNKNDIKDEEYNEFYHYIGHDHEDPLFRLHFSTDAPLSIQALLFVPANNIEALGLTRTESEVHLYSRKVLIMSRPKDLLPEWLRFLRGVVDSEDLPLNISRETMQDTSLMEKLNKILTGRFIKFLDEQSAKDPAAYDKFYEQYNRFIKEGIVSDYTHSADLGKLLRYETSSLPKGQKTSLADYVKRMPSEQKEIYYLLGPNRESLESSPYYEAFKSHHFEVVFLSDPWDEFVMDHLREFDGKTLKPAEKADITVENPNRDGALSEADAKDLAKWIKDTLGDRLHEVRSSQRLVDSPAVIVDSDKFMTASMRRILKAMHKEQDAPAPSQQDLEINPRHPIIVQLNAMRQQDPALAAKVTEQLVDNARVAAGLLEDPRTMLKRLNELLEQVLKATTPSKA